MSKPKKKRKSEAWQIAENIAASIEHARGRNAGWKVLQNVGIPLIKNPKKTRQFDVVLKCPAGPRTFLLAIDVRDKGRRLDVDEMAALISKRKKVALDRFIVLSRSGFTKEAQDDAAAANVELLSFEKRAPIFEIAEVAVNTQSFKGFAMTIHYEVNPEPLPHLSDIDKVLARVDGQPLRRLAELVYAEAQRVVNSLHFPDGAPFDIRLDNRPGVVKDLVVEGVAYPAPSVIIARGTVCLETLIVPATRITTSDGHVALASVVPFNGDLSQLTLVGTPNPDGSTQLAATFGPAKPNKLTLSGDAESPLQIVPVHAIEVHGHPRRAALPDASPCSSSSAEPRP